ncbi:MAG: fibronectin type III domain-containing protein [Vicinamibacteraceae bacterium]
MLAALLWLAGTQAAAAAGLTLAWDANSEPHLSAYVVSYGTSAGARSGNVIVTPSVTRVRLENLTAGTRYYVIVRALGTSGQFSVPSAEVNGVASDTLPAAPAGSAQTYYAEGASGFFDYRVAVLNTAASQTWLNVSYLREGASPITRSYSVGGGRRMTISADDIPELNGASFAAVVSAPPSVVSERTMRWRLNGADGASGAKALTAPSTTWYLAEGNAGFFDTYVLLANPSATPTVATVDFLLDGGGVVRRQYSLSGNSRYTVWTNQIPELAFRSFATTVTSPQAILVERAMYFHGPHGAFEGGHASAAVPSGARNWFLAEGSTGAWFETFVLISNPNTSAVTATIRYLTPSGVARTEVRALPPTSRTTIPVDGLPGLASTDVSCSITATGNIIVERSMYWPGVPGPWYGAHNSVGTTTLRTRYGLAEGEVGGVDGASTYVLLANPGSTAATATVTFYREDDTPIVVTRSVPAGSRQTISAGTVGLASGDRFGVVVDSTQPIAVERSVYWNYLGALWTSGTNETGTPLN